MGIFVGNIHVLAMIWAGVQALVRVEPGASPIWLVAAAVVIGNLAVLPLSIISSGEVGFPVWTFISLLTARQSTKARTRQPAGPLMSEREWERQAEAIARQSRRFGHGS